VDVQVGRKIYYIGGQTTVEGPRLNEILVYDFGALFDERSLSPMAQGKASQD
jgi:hypothetical protein